MMSEFMFRLKYRNELPDLPFDPKLLEYPFPADRLYRFSENSLHTSTPLPLYAASADDESGLPVCPLSHGFIEFAFRNPNESLQERPKQLDPEDAVLLTKPVDAAKAKLNAAARVRPNVSWLRRTEYISAEGKTFTRKKDDKSIETTMGYNVVKNDETDGKPIDISRKAQMNAIESTFEAAASASLLSIKHPTKEDLTPLEVIPLFPDFEFWSNNYTVAMFEDDPFGRNSNNQNSNDAEIYEPDLKLEDSLLKLVPNLKDQADGRLAMYTPTDTTARELREKRMHPDEVDEDDKIYEYAYHSEYGATVQPMKEHPFFIEIREDQHGAFYSKISTRMHMKRKPKPMRQDFEDGDEFERPTKLQIVFRDPSKEEEEQDVRTTRDAFGESVI